MKKRKTERTPLSQFEPVTPEDILDVFTTSYQHHNTNKSKKPAPTLELATWIHHQLDGYHCSLHHLIQQFGDGLRLLALDYNKVNKTSKSVKTQTGKTYTMNDWGTFDVYELAKRLWDKNSIGGFGIRGGNVGNGKHLVIVDVDDGSREFQQRLLARLGTKTYIVRTPRRQGIHIYFWSDRSVGCPRRWTGKHRASIDIIGEGKYAVAPGYKLKDYGLYAPDSENEYFDWNVARLPVEWESTLDEFLAVNPDEHTSLRTQKSKKQSSLSTSKETNPYAGTTAKKMLARAESNDGFRVEVGARYFFCLKMAGYFLSIRWDRERILDKLVSWKDSIFDKPETFNDNEISRAIEWVMGEHESKRNKEEEQSSGALTYYHNKTKLNMYDISFGKLLLIQEEHSTKIDDAVVLYRRFLTLTGARYVTPGAKTVGTMLTLLGYSKNEINQRRGNGTRTKVKRWNVNLDEARVLVESLTQNSLKANQSSLVTDVSSKAS